MFLLTTEDAQNLALPDSCLTPSPAGPVPIPYPNISETSTATPDTIALKVLVDGMPSLTISSEIPMSEGDEEGTNMGVVSGEVMGATAYVDSSEVLMLNGSPAVRLTSATGQNGSTMNAEGACLVPSQELMIVLS
jgi:hypothetical protein